jgi:putative membrane protein
MNRRTALWSMAGVFAALWLLLAIDPVERDTWLLENVLIFLAITILLTTRHALPLSTASYAMVFGFLCLHAIGAHYTYSLVPYDTLLVGLGLPSLDVALDLQRNHYDRLVHFAYGLLLALPLRELLMRFAAVRGFWSYFLPLDIVMSSSLCYELIEWGAAAMFGGDMGAAFLGTQGDEWDAHQDMFLASVGGLLAMLVVWRINRFRRRDMTLEWLAISDARQ